MTEVPFVTFTYTAGDTVVLDFFVLGPDGVTPANLLGVTPRFAMARRRGGMIVLGTDDGSAVAVVTSPSEGQYRVTIDAQQTNDLRGVYEWHSRIEDVSGGISTPAEGLIVFDRPVLAPVGP